MEEENDQEVLIEMKKKVLTFEMKRKGGLANEHAGI